MLSAITNTIANQHLANIALNPIAQVSIETTLKAIGRPAAILVDKDISPDTKQYAASKEFLYQATRLLTFLGLIVPLYRKGGFQLAKKVLFKDKPEFQKFENVKEFEHYMKLTKKSIEDRRLTLQKEKVKDKYHPDVRKDLETNENPETYPLIVSTIGVFNLMGSVLGLAVLAPQVSHMFIHPALRLLGLEEKNKKGTEEQKTAPAAKIDTKA